MLTQYTCVCFCSTLESHPVVSVNQALQMGGGICGTDARHDRPMTHEQDTQVLVSEHADTQLT